MRETESAVSKEAQERKIYGVIAVILSLDDKILLVEETEDRPEYDKQAGDFSHPTETIEEGETIFEALTRVFDEEAGGGEKMICDLEEDWLGDYQIAGTGYWGRAYLVHYQGASDSLIKFKTKGDVANPRWVKPKEVKNMPRRAGVLEVVEDFLQGLRGVIREECSPGFRPE